MLNELKIFKDVIDKLNRNDIPYMVSGSIAMSYYVLPRMTRDIDIVIEINDPEKFYNIFKDDYFVDLKMVKDAINRKQMFNIIHLNEIIKIDFIIRKDEHYRINEFNRRRKIKIDDLYIYIVSIEDLIISKLLWAKDSYSELQIRDVKNLLKEKIDLSYINTWIKKLELEEFFNKVVKENK